MSEQVVKCVKCDTVFLLYGIRRVVRPWTCPDCRLSSLQART